jgi:hypothetical protein
VRPSVVLCGLCDPHQSLVMCAECSGRVAHCLTLWPLRPFSSPLRA